LPRSSTAMERIWSLHGQAHHGTMDGQTLAGIPVRNVAISLLQEQKPPHAYRLFDIECRLVASSASR
jgi:hypothetical protein